jgi:superfamily II DNA or RNA helicase
MKIDLRPYQDEAIENLRRLFGEKFIRLILCAPTGAGKVYN